MVHEFVRRRGESVAASVARARARHTEIGGVDAEAYLEMAQQLLWDSFTPYRQLVPSLLAALGADDWRVLDLGCGPGPLESALLPSIADLSIDAVDASTDMLAVVERELGRYRGEGRLRLHCRDIQEDPPPVLAPMSILKGTAHHLSDLEAGLANIAHCTARPGLLIVQDYRREGDVDTILPFIRGLLSLSSDEFGLYSRVLGYVDSRRVAYSIEETSAALQAAGWKLIQVLESSDEQVQLAGRGLDNAQEVATRTAFATVFSEAGFEQTQEANDDKA